MRYSMLGILVFYVASALAQTLPQLRVSESRRYLEYHTGQPFFWMGCTSWGMSEWLTREDIIHYLEDRKSKGFNVVQICAFWGKRREEPVIFSLNPTNAYGFKAFAEISGSPHALQPSILEGGTPDMPNDYWDHLEFIIKEARERNMQVALLPVWGRRYVNATHASHSTPFFDRTAMKSYGEFLGGLLGAYKNLIWVLGGDVQANAGGNHLGHYRAMAEGIVLGITGHHVGWDQDSPLWDAVLMTYHPDGRPFANSSRWFHEDPWLDFHMIETHRHHDSVYRAIQLDYHLTDPIKPTVMGEPDYEGHTPNKPTLGLHMRRQAFHSYFGGAAGFTYGGKIDSLGNGPLWSPYEGWKDMLDMEGAVTIGLVKRFCLEHGWPRWVPDNSLMKGNIASGELQKVAVKNTQSEDIYIYFPDSSSLFLELTKNPYKAKSVEMEWFNPSNGRYTILTIFPVTKTEFRPPKSWNDAVMVMRFRR